MRTLGMLITAVLLALSCTRMRPPAQVAPASVTEAKASTSGVYPPGQETIPNTRVKKPCMFGSTKEQPSSLDNGLSALDELPLSQDVNCGEECYRFFLYGSVMPPMMVRFSRSGTTYKAYYKSMQGALLATKERLLSDSEWANVQQLIQHSEFWNLSTYEEPTDDIQLDIVVWQLEANCNGKYHLVKRLPSQSTCFTETCQQLCGLAKLGNVP